MRRGLGAEDGVGLEEQDAVCRGEVFPEPGLGQEDGDGGVVGEGGLLGEEVDADSLFGHVAFEDGRGRFDPCGAQGEDYDGSKGWAEMVCEMEDYGDEVGDAGYVCFHEDGDVVRKLPRWRGRRRRGWGWVESMVEGVGYVEIVTR